MIEEHPLVKKIIRLSLIEDIGPGDITTSLLVEQDFQVQAKLIAKEQFLLAGISIFKQVFRELSSSVSFEEFFQDGDLVEKDAIICKINGSISVILKAERTALNFLQRMSGIATMTKRFVDEVSHTKVRILDTRKTSPGMRILDKYAVRIGGGYNHRLGLFDGILIKDNHIAAVGSIKKAIELAKKQAPHTLKIEVEVENIEQLVEAIEAGADIVLLDNMEFEQIREAVRLAKGKVLIEVSGGVRLENVRRIAELGVDFISIGALTHSVKGVDISLEI